MVHVIEEVRIEFVNEPYKTLLDICKQALENGEVPDTKFYVHHEDIRISSIAAELISVKHVLSDKWKEHDIHIPKEEHIIKKVVDSGLDHLQLKKLMHVLDEIQKQIKDAKSDEEVDRFLQYYAQTKSLVTVLEKKLGLVVMK